MAKQFFQRLLPSSEQITRLKFMRIFGQHALNPRLWYVNRKSIVAAMFIGTFFGLLPIPFHSLFIVAAVILFEVNLPLALALAWLSNPLTLAPILYIGFWIGAKVFHVHMINKDMILGVLHQISRWIQDFGHGHVDLSLAKILMTGLVIEALLVAILFALATALLWRLNIYRYVKRKQQQSRVKTSVYKAHS